MGGATKKKSRNGKEETDALKILSEELYSNAKTGGRSVPKTKATVKIMESQTKLNRSSRAYDREPVNAVPYSVRWRVRCLSPNWKKNGGKRTVGAALIGSVRESKQIVLTCGKKGEKKQAKIPQKSGRGTNGGGRGRER